MLYVLFAAASKPEAGPGLGRYAAGAMARLEVLADAPPMPSRPLKDAAGQDASLAAFKGQVLVVNFWATWCPPCVEEMPTLGALQRRFGARIRVLPVNVDGAAKLEEARAQLARLGEGDLPFLSDISRGVLFDARAPGMPLTIIYDASGQEAARLAGGADWASDDAAALIEAVLAEE